MTAASSRRWPRRLLALLGVLLLALAAAEWAEWPFLRRPLESALGRALQREVSVGPGFGLRLLGRVRLHAERLEIGPPAAGPQLNGQAPPLLSATGLRLVLPYSSVLAWLVPRPEAVPVVELLAADTLQATLLRDADGRANWQVGAPDEAAGPPPPLPRFTRLALGRAQLTLDDAPTRLSVRAQAHSQPMPAPASGSALQISVDGRYRDEPLSGRGQILGLAALVDDLSGQPASPGQGGLPVKLQARLGSTEFDFDGTLHDMLQLGRVGGRFRLAGPSLAATGSAAGLTLPTTGPYLMQGELNKSGPVWGARLDRLHIGSSRLTGNFRYDPTPAVPKLSGQLAGTRLYMPDLGPALGGRVKAPGAAPPPAPSGRVLPQREFDIPALAAMDADIAVAIEQFDFGTEQLAKIEPLQARLTLSKQELALADILARTADGTLRGKIRLDARPRHATPRWEADLSWSAVQLERFLRPRNVVERDASRGYLSGSLDGRARLAGSGRSIAQVLGSADGEVQTLIRNGQISHFLVEVLGLDLAQALGMFVRGDDMLPMACAVGALKLRQGTAYSDLLLIDTRDSTLSGGGSVSLGQEKLDLVFRAQPKDISPLAVRAPVHVEGSFAAPDVRLEKAPIAKRLAAAAALAAITPLAGLLALVDLGEPERQVCESALRRLDAGTKARKAQ